MKICTCCKKELSIDNFAFKNKKLGKRNAKCHICRHKKQKISYYKHHETNLKRIKGYKKDNIKWFQQMKQNLSCSICGEKESACLDFHHIDSLEKDFNIAKARGSSRNLILKELSKCACLCANCHRKVHANKLNNVLKKIDINALVSPDATNVVKGNWTHAGSTPV